MGCKISCKLLSSANKPLRISCWRFKAFDMYHESGCSDAMTCKTLAAESACAKMLALLLSPEKSFYNSFLVNPAYNEKQNKLTCSRVRAKKRNPTVTSVHPFCPTINCSNARALGRKLLRAAGSYGMVVKRTK